MRGLLLDTSVLIRAEREAVDVWDALLKVREQTGATDVGVSTLTLMELAYGLFAQTRRAVGAPGSASSLMSRVCWMCIR